MAHLRLGQVVFLDARTAQFSDVWHMCRNPLQRVHRPLTGGVGGAVPDRSVRPSSLIIAYVRAWHTFINKSTIASPYPNRLPIWRDIALRLEKPKRNWAEANLSKLERYAQDGETIVVPGKVLAAGNISKKITVAAYDFSDAAAKAIVAAGGKTLTLEELAESNPKGTGVRIMR